MARVEILMTTYNGSSYVGEQIDSILCQTYQDFHLTISDDHSSDNTLEILHGYQARNPEKISVVSPEHRFGNARDHFFHMLENCNADYIFFSDQDDVWFSNKVELLMREFGDGVSNTPILVFSDQTPTDAKLNPLDKSLMHYQKQEPHITDFRELVFQNVVTGGAMAINAALRDKALKCLDKTKTIMHDHWIAIVAACFGRCVYIDQATSYYRQHGGNEVGAKKIGSLSYFIGKMSKLSDVRKKILLDKAQAHVFLDTFRNELSIDSVKFLEGYSKDRSGLAFYLKNSRYIHGSLRLYGKLFLG